LLLIENQQKFLKKSLNPCGGLYRLWQKQKSILSLHHDVLNEEIGENLEIPCIGCGLMIKCRIQLEGRMTGKDKKKCSDWLPHWFDLLCFL